jgi:cell division transport system permease protein
MCILAGLALGVALGVNRATRAWSAELSLAVTVEITPIETMTMGEQVEAAQAFLRGQALIAKSRPLSREENLALIEPWLGEFAGLPDLPVPQLIDVRLVPDAPEDLSDLGERLAAAVPGARLDTHRRWRGELLILGLTVRSAAFGALILVLVATVVTVIFATRAGLIANRNIIDVLHTVGARDGFIAHAFERHFFRSALVGGLCGSLIAILAFFAVNLLSRRLPGSELARFAPSLRLEPTDFAILAGIAPAAALIAMLTARVTILRSLARMV